MELDKLFDLFQNLPLILKIALICVSLISALAVHFFKDSSIKLKTIIFSIISISLLFIFVLSFYISPHKNTVPKKGNNGNNGPTDTTIFTPIDTVPLPRPKKTLEYVALYINIENANINNSYSFILNGKGKEIKSSHFDEKLVKGKNYDLVIKMHDINDGIRTYSQNYLAFKNDTLILFDSNFK